MILAEFTEFTGNFPAIANQCLQKLPSANNKFTYNCDHHTFNFLVEDGYGKNAFNFLLVFDLFPVRFWCFCVGFSSIFTGNCWIWSDQCQVYSILLEFVWKGNLDLDLEMCFCVGFD